MKNSSLTLCPNDMKIYRLTKKTYYTNVRWKKTGTIVYMGIITSTASYTKNNKIKLYLHFKMTQE